MRQFILSAIAVGATIATAVPVMAADMPEPPPVYSPPPEVEVEVGGWYLRGDVGFTNQAAETFYSDYWTVGSNVFIGSEPEFSPSYFIGAGIGYQFNGWLRSDATMEYRAKSDFDGSDTYTNATPQTGGNFYDTDKTELVGLLNIYADLGTWGGLTPFIGAGIGFATIMMGELTDSGYNYQSGRTPELITSLATADSATTTNFAWALMAGFGYQVAPGVTAEVAYRYLDMGTAETGALDIGGTDYTIVVEDITSHDVRFGLRWAMAGGAEMAPDPQPFAYEPIITK
jgi:opacity protein-like surface antigen